MRARCEVTDHFLGLGRTIFISFRFFNAYYLHIRDCLYSVRITQAIE